MNRLGVIPPPSTQWIWKIPKEETFIWPSKVLKQRYPPQIHEVYMPCVSKAKQCKTETPGPPITAALRCVSTRPPIVPKSHQRSARRFASLQNSPEVATLLAAKEGVGDTGGIRGFWDFGEKIQSPLKLELMIPQGIKNITCLKHDAGRCIIFGSVHVSKKESSVNWQPVSIGKSRTLFSPFSEDVTSFAINSEELNLKRIL